MSWPWVTLALLGAWHGLNPGMGWLFAVAIGLQERSTRKLLAALGPIAAGHAASVFVVAGLVGGLRSVFATRVVAIVGGVLLVGFGLWRALSKRHFRWAGMKLTPWQLTSWSFLMSSVHGAGLMLVPVLVAAPPPGLSHSDHAIHAASSGDASALLWQGLAATAVHTLSMTVVAGTIALVVYKIVGLQVLRTAWVNLDLVWAVALIGSGAAAVALTV